MNAQRPAWTLSEAVERTSASRATLKRLLAADGLPNAYKDQRGRWRIPITDLIAAGHPPSSSIEGIAPTEEETNEAGTAGHIAALEAELRTMRIKLEAAQSIAEAHQLRADSAERALRLLEAPKKSGVTDLAQGGSNEPPEPAQKENPQVTVSSPEPGEPAQPGSLKRLWRAFTRHA
ncbi:hypothetical protein [Eggerthella sp.]|uniref:hypothetical protein n=1 Tax=Eggerthella sp. TaxID=1929886 RepID=UPI0028FE4CC0|nr:hypothetical protein [Eggerthella sp.]MDU3173772.1 hypothetical protein [Eggerthella sp.]